MKILKTGWSIIINVFTFLVLGVIIAVLACFLCGIKPYITMSGSMEPTIHTGSVCIVNTKADFSAVQEGDIIAFETSAGGLVTHRAIAVSSEGIETKGDNNDISDGVTTTAQNFRGETLFSVPYLGYGLVYLQQPAGFAIACVILVTVIILNVLDSISERKEKREKKEMETADSDM